MIKNMNPWIKYGSIVVAVLGAMGGSGACYAFFAANSELTTTDLPTKIELTYGDNLNLSKYKISKYSYAHTNLCNIPIEPAMVKNYSPEKIGYQYPYIEFEDFKRQFTVSIKPKKIDSVSLFLDNQKLCWNSVNNIKNYSIFLGREENKLSLLKDVNDTSIDLESLVDSGYYYAKIEANPINEKYSKYTSDVFKFFKLPEVQNISLDNEFLIWDDVEGTDYYKIMINNLELTTSDNKVKLQNINVGKNNISVQACSKLDFINSENTNVILNQSGDFELRQEKSQISWTKSESAISYDVYVDDKFINNQVETSYDTKALKNGLHKFKIIARCNNENSLESNAIVEETFYINGYSEISNSKLKFSKINDNNIKYKYSIKIDGKQIDNGIIDDKSNNDYIYYDVDRFGTLLPGYHNLVIEALDTTNQKVFFITNLRFEKLDKPIIKYDGNKIIKENSLKSYQLYIDGKEFNGNLDSIDIGKHNIYAVNNATEINTIKSGKSNILLYNMKQAPSIKIANNKLVSDYSGDNIKWFINNKSFDGNLTNLNSGNYSIKAKIYTGTENSIENSNYSNIINVNKLSTPKLMLENGKVKIDNLSEKYEIYVNGNLYKGNFSDLSCYNDSVITVKNIPAKTFDNNTYYIESPLSNSLTVRNIPDIDLRLTEKDNNQFLLTYKALENLDIKITLDYLKNNEVINSQSYDKKGTGNYDFLRLYGSTESDKLRVTVLVSGNNYISKEFVVEK